MDEATAQDRAAVWVAVLERYLADRESGKARALEEYAELFPEHRAFVASRLSELGPTPDALGSIGPYRLVREIGRGGQGVVYLAEDPRLGRRVALKVLPLVGDRASELARRFQREAEVASRLDHPGICSIHEAGASGGVLYIAMRYVQGETLAARIARSREVRASGRGEPRTPSASRRALEATLELFEKCAMALHHAHEAGVIHRDVKPANVLIDARGEPVVLDFGLAREVEDLDALTRTGDLFGTPAYMAPEQLDPERAAVDRRTDVYALGVSLHEALTGRRPFEATTREGLFHAILAGDPPDPRRFEPLLPRDLCTVLATALAKEPERRYASALDLAEDLRRVRSKEPIRARPISWTGRALRWAQRSPVRAALALVLALGVPLVGALTAYVLASRGEVETARGALHRGRVERAIDRGFTLLVTKADAAGEAFREALELEPTNVEATVGYALHLVRSLSVLRPSSGESDSEERAARAREALAFLDAQERSIGRHPDLLRARSHCLELSGADAEAAALRAEIGDKQSALGALIEASRRWKDFLTIPTNRTAAREVHRYATLACDLAPRPQLFYYALRGTAAREAGRSEETRMMAELVLERWPGDLDARLHVGCMTAGWPGSAELLEEVLRGEPENVIALVYLAKCRLAAGDREAASSAIERALAIAAPDPFVHCRLGLLLFLCGKAREAIDCFELVLARWPDAHEAWLGRGLARAALGELDAAESDYRRALSLREDSLGAPWCLGRSLAEQGRFDEAIPLLRRAVEIDDQQWRLWELYADALELAGRDGEARSAWESATERIPDEFHAWNGLAWFLVDPAGRAARWSPDAAVYAAERALGLPGGRSSPDAVDTWGVALYRRGEDERARDTLLRSVQMNAAADQPPSVADLAYLAAASARLGRIAEAWDWLERARARLEAIEDRPGKPLSAALAPWDERSSLEAAHRTARAALAEAETVVESCASAARR